MEGTLFDEVRRHALDQPQATALWHWPRGSRVPIATSYATLAERAGRFACSFLKDERAGEIIGLFLSKGPDAVAAMLGALGAAKAFASLHRKLKAPQLRRIFEAIGPTTAIVDGPGVMTVAESVEAGDVLSRIRWKVLFSEPPPPREASAMDRLRGRLDLPAFEMEPAGALPSFNPGETRLGCCLFTSGSTGYPKGVMIAAADLQARAATEAECFGLRSSDVLLNLLPFSFDVGLNQLFSALYAGCSIVLTDSWLPADIARVSAELQVTGISAVPSIWIDMLNAGISFDTAVKHRSIRYITISGGDLPDDRRKRLNELAPGAGVFKTYGQSETFRSTLLYPEEFLAKPGSVGRPFGTAKVYVLRPDGSLCAAGEKGEIVHTGLGTMLGYLGDRPGADALRANPFTGPDDPAVRAVFTGDIGWFDEEGFFFISGRRDAMLKVSGNRVYPNEIANQVLSLAGVLEAAVVGVPAANGATELYGFVVLSADAPPTAALRRMLTQRLPSYMLPKEIITLSEMPRTPSGKTDDPALITLAMDRVNATATTT